MRNREFRSPGSQLAFKRRPVCENSLVPFPAVADSPHILACPIQMQLIETAVTAGCTPVLQLVRSRIPRSAFIIVGIKAIIGRILTAAVSLSSDHPLVIFINHEFNIAKTGTGKVAGVLSFHRGGVESLYAATKIVDNLWRGRIITESGIQNAPR